MSKTLVAYFSCSGVTEKLAQKIAGVSGGDLYRIQPAAAYTNDDLNWQDANSRSSVEMRDKSSRPGMAGKLPDMAQYDTVYVGFPIWWYVAPTIINTFLESADFSGKTVIPFATSGGSDVGETDAYLRGSCSKETHWRPAKRFPSSVQPEAIRKWISGLGV